MPDLQETIDDIIGVVDANTLPKQPDTIARQQIGHDLAQRRKYTEWSEFPAVIDDALAVAVKGGRLVSVDDDEPYYGAP